MDEGEGVGGKGEGEGVAVGVEEEGEAAVLGGNVVDVGCVVADLEERIDRRQELLRCVELRVGFMGLDRDGLHPMQVTYLTYDT